MFCKNCGNQINKDVKFCTSCGTAFSVNMKQQDQSIPFSLKKFKNKINLGLAIRIIIVVLVVGWIVYVNFDDNAIETNNDAITSVESGDSNQAIIQLQEASKTAITNVNKLNSLKNLAYVYVTEERLPEALVSFQEALKLSKENSLDYYLISAEIALLQNKPNLAYINFNKALGIDPNDFQVNNSLAIFYLNLDGVSADYEDYSKALVYALKAHELSDSEVTRQNLGIAYYYNDKYDESIAILSKTNITQHPYIGLWIGYNYIEKNDENKARSYFMQAINAGAEAPQEIIDYLNI